MIDNTNKNMTEREKKELFSEIKQVINIELVKRDINSIQCSKKDVENFNNYYELYESLDKNRLENDTNEIISKICEEIPNHYKELTRKHKIGFNIVDAANFMLLKPINLIDKVYVNFYVFEINNEDDYDKVKDNFVCYYRPHKNALYVDVAVSRFGDVQKKQLYDIISSELKRVYFLKIKGSKKVNKLYNLSKEIIAGNWFKNDNINYYLAYLLYFTSYSEVNNICKEITIEIKRKRLNTFEELNNNSFIYNEILCANHIFNKIIDNEFSILNYKKNMFLGLDYNYLIDYITIAIRYLNKSVSKSAGIALFDYRPNHIGESEIFYRFPIEPQNGIKSFSELSKRTLDAIKKHKVE